MSDLSTTSMDQLIPHKGAMRLIDRVVDLSADHAIAEVDVGFDGIFVRDGAVPAWIGIEYMAQTIAAWSGWKAKASGHGMRLGMLVGTRKFEMHTPEFTCGSTLRIHANCELVAAGGLGMFECRIETADEREPRVLATAMVSVYESADSLSSLIGKNNG